VLPVDYFKGRQFPSYVDDAGVRQNLKEEKEDRERMEEYEEMEHDRDRRVYLEELDEEIVSMEVDMFDYGDLGSQYYINTYDLDDFEDYGNTIVITGKRKDIDRMIREEQKVNPLPGGTY
jgi:hypothetical protein